MAKKDLRELQNQVQQMRGFVDSVSGMFREAATTGERQRVGSYKTDNGLVHLWVVPEKVTDA